jgi:hypothetical protein
MRTVTGERPEGRGTPRPLDHQLETLIVEARAVAAELRKVAEDLRAAVDALKEHRCAPTPDRQ